MVVYRILVTGCLFLAFSSETISGDDVEGYYWRDYKGIIPKDAFEAAYDKSGNPIFVGQVLHRHMLLPARISLFPHKVAYEWGYTEFIASVSHNVKIFCTRHPEQLQWVQINSKGISKVHGKVEAGYEVNITTHIGRKYFNGEYTVGKVNAGKTEAVLYTTKNGKADLHIDYEVLTYNPYIKPTNNTVVSNSINPNTSSCKTKQIVINYYV